MMSRLYNVAGPALDQFTTFRKKEPVKYYSVYPMLNLIGFHMEANSDASLCKVGIRQSRLEMNRAIAPFVFRKYKDNSVACWYMSTFDGPFLIEPFCRSQTTVQLLHQDQVRRPILCCFQVFRQLIDAPLSFLTRCAR